VFEGTHDYAIDREVHVWSNRSVKMIAVSPHAYADVAAFAKALLMNG